MSSLAISNKRSVPSRSFPLAPLWRERVEMSESKKRNWSRVQSANREAMILLALTSSIALDPGAVLPLSQYGRTIGADYRSAQTSLTVGQASNDRFLCRCTSCPRQTLRLTGTVASMLRNFTCYVELLEKVWSVHAPREKAKDEIRLFDLLSSFPR